MNDLEIGIEEGFYQKVAEVLKCDSNYEKFPFRKRTRWNSRASGNGRYLGHGLVRFYGPTNIHVALIKPKINGVYHTIDEAIDAIHQACD
jgi:hypothetical protein